MSDRTVIKDDTISSVKLLICNTLKQRGIDPNPLCEAAGLSLPDMLHPMRRDDTPKLSKLMQLAIDITAEESFPLEVASRISITTFSSFGAAIIASDNLETALLRCQKYSSLLSGSSQVNIIKNDSRITAQLISTDPFRALCPNLVLLHIASGLMVGRTLSSTNVIPLEVKLKQLPPENTEPYTALFGCPVLFGQPVDCLSLRNEDLNTPFATHDPRLSELTQDIAMKDLSKLTALTVAEEVCVFVEDALAEGEPKIADIARDMGLSPRSLQRKLAADNQTFAQLLDKTRKHLAHEMVLQPSEQIKNLAYDLGFSDQSNFNRAFKRWFSMNPTEYRRQFGDE